MQKLRWPLLLVALGILGWNSLCSTSSSSSTTVLNPLHEGDSVDHLFGVIVHYNGSVGHVSGRNLSADGYNLGLKWQCVEFVKRFYFEHYRHKMPDSYGHARSFYNPSIGDGKINPGRDLLQYSNPSASKPRVGDLMVMDGTRLNPYGHVAIVAAVLSDSVQIIQQNPGPLGDSRDWFHLDSANGKWNVTAPNLLGWLRMRHQPK